MELKAVKHPTQPADRCWVVVDMSVTVDHDDPYAVAGKPIQWMPDVVEYYDHNGNLIRVKSPKRFFSRKRDAQAAIDSL